MGVLPPRVFAAGYDLLLDATEWAGMARQRHRLVGGLAGDVLEVGVGTGRNLPHYRTARSVTGIDPDRAALDRARRRRCPAPVELVEGSAHDLPFPDGRFDAVVACLSLCTIPDPARGLAEMHRVLRPGGALHYLEHVRSGRPWVASAQQRVRGPWMALADGCDLTRDTSSAIRAAGFVVEREWRSGDGRGVVIAGLARPGG